MLTVFMDADGNRQAESNQLKKDGATHKLSDDVDSDAHTLNHFIVLMVQMKSCP